MTYNVFSGTLNPTHFTWCMWWHQRRTFWTFAMMCCSVTVKMMQS